MMPHIPDSLPVPGTGDPLSPEQPPEKRARRALLDAVMNDSSTGILSMSDSDLALVMDEPVPGDLYGRTPLMLAAWYGKLSVMNTLIGLGAELERADANGRPAHEYVKQFGAGADARDRFLSWEQDSLKSTLKRRISEAPPEPEASPAPRKGPRRPF
jgi:hypothetical protein